MSAPARFLTIGFALLALTIATGCSQEQKSIEKLTDLAGAEFAVPTGTVADQLVQAVITDATFQYYNSVLDAAMAVKTGRADAAAYDEPILRNIAARNPGLTVLQDRITIDEYGFAVSLDDTALKSAIDAEVSDLRASGDYAAMMKRWLPDEGEPAAMPDIPEGTGDVLRFGTAAVTEPFSFYNGQRQIVGIDVEIARRVAARMGRRLEIVDMEFGAMIPALIAGKVDFIGACITITEERAKSVLFSNSYYTGGISALVRQPATN
ncbi:MAG: transporter substrate-binding domain-containing protein [Pseudomonadales bacterium]